MHPDEWHALLADKHHPLNNRAIQGQYPPGSTFKIIVATAALEEGVINPFTRIHCPGGLQFGNHYFRCWKKGGHGSVNLHEALVQSCDVFFYQVAQRLGIDTIAQYARTFGLGMPTGIDLEHEKAGTIPDTRVEAQALQAAVVRRRDAVGRHRPGLRDGDTAADGERDRHGRHRQALPAALRPPGRDTDGEVVHAETPEETRRR